ncbi:hybrid sensor histidine kinase/response regulator [Pleionea sediminis]|uniref:hybrid sensor histidine kinase/response regulator n=1 Tax=Pleionea sediminis TaxID=2569479 RepID=UPI001184B750|nr:ATP-binding protein [Pleionea sediminis]
MSEKVQNKRLGREQDFESTLHDLLVGVVVHDRDTSILYSNPEASNILGLNREQMSGKRAIDQAWCFLHEDLTVMQVGDYPVSQVFATKKTLKNLVLGVNRPDREYITWVMVNATPIFSDDGELDKAIINFVDITERKHAEEDKLELEKQLKQAQKMEALGTLAGGIAHDFNNLLAPIIGYSELLRLQLKGSEKLIEKINHIEDSAKRAKDLVKKILVISRTSIPSLNAVQLDELANEVVTVIKASAPPNIQIEFNIEPDLPPIAAESSQIYQVILNLMLNAIQSISQKGKVVLSLDSTQPYDSTNEIKTAFQYICLTVSDNGSGMSEATIEKIFDPFFTTKEKDEHRGTGLGLSIIANIVKQHDGFIEVESELNIGTTFKIYFPIMSGKSSAILPLTHPSLLLGEGNILLVDDELVVNNMGVEVLSQLGYTVTSFLDSHKALKAFKSAPDKFDLIITDYSMPKLMGPELMKEIKSIRPDIPILLVTGYLNLRTSENLRSWGCDGIIDKPYNINKLSQTISRVMNTKSSTSQN